MALLQAIDDVVAMVDELEATISRADFNVLSTDTAKQWEAVKQEFADAEAEVGAATQQLIDKSFRWVAPFIFWG